MKNLRMHTRPGTGLCALILAGLLALSGLTSPSAAQHDPAGSRTFPGVLPMKDQAAAIDRMLEERMETVIPMIMRRAGVDVWIVAAREYNEDPVIRSMLPATWIAARRRTVLMFHDAGPDAPIQRLAVARYDIGTLFKGSWDPETQPDQWARVADLVREWNPRVIGVNRSETFGLADGITASEYDALLAALGPDLAPRVRGAEELAVGWLETRTPSEMAAYPTIMRMARSILSEGLSEVAITPGVTTTEDVEWWYRDRIRELGLVTWFHPSVDVQRAGSNERDNDFSAREGVDVILPGDLVHVDFGITYLRLNTDTQMLAYVLRPGETAPPDGLVRGLAVGNRLQDILTDEFVAGRSGNDILRRALDQAAREGIEATIYTHPIGFQGHGAGPTIGLWDMQGGVPGKGDYPLYPNTAHSIELNAAVAIPEWDGKTVRIMLEEDAFFDGEHVWYIDPRQTELLLIPR
ncbi:MAG: M24 family metallopeptidase [Rhodothermales bacterium]